MEEYIGNIKQIFENVDIKIFIKDCNEILSAGYFKDEPNNYHIYTIIPPVLYFFDQYLNKDVCSSPEILDKFTEITTIKNMPGIKDDNVITNMNIGILQHATIIHTFNYKSSFYLYYSNSGLGIENQFNTETTTCCKLYKIDLTRINAVDQTPKTTMFGEILNQLFSIIKLIEKTHITLFTNQTHGSEKVKKILIAKLKSMCQIIKRYIPSFDENILSQPFLILFYDNVNKQNNKNHYYYLIYTFLNYLVSNDIMSDISFEELLMNRPNEVYQANMRNVYIHRTTGNKYSFTELYQNIYMNVNTDIYRHIQNTIDIAPDKNIYNSFIDDINHELDLFANLSNVFRFKRNDIILDLKPSGLYNYTQKSGSCTFYSYYNLLLNKLFLNNCDLYSTESHKAVKNVVDTILNIHYIMLYSLCVCNDNNYITHDGSTNKIFHFNYLYNILIQKNLEDEITRFYSNDTLLFFYKQPLIDSLLHTPIEGNLEKIKNPLEINNVLIQQTNLYMLKLNNYLNLIINQIRNKKHADILSIKKELYRNRNQLLPIIRNYLGEKCINYILMIYDIYLIYFWYFIQLYTEPVQVQTRLEWNKDSEIYILEPLYYSKDIDTTVCNSQEECTLKHCNYRLYTNNFTNNIDIFFSKFHLFEQYNLSQLVKDKYKEDINSIHELLNFDYCGFIFTTTFKTISLSNNIFLNYDNMIFDNDISIPLNMKTLENITLLVSTYIRLTYLNINDNIDHLLKQKYTSQQNIIVDVIKKIIVQKINVKYDNSNFISEIYNFIFKLCDNYVSSIILLIFILSNKKYLIINDNIYCENSIIYTLLHIINENTIVIKGNISFETICSNLQHILNNNIEKINYGNDIEAHSNWIKNYNLILIDNDKKVFSDKSMMYEVFKPKYSSPISKILSRFGCFNQNHHEFIILFPSKQLLDITPGEPIIKELKKTNERFKIFICIKKNQTIIELNCIEDKLQIDDCFYYKNLYKFKLEFNIDIPFKSLISETTPYLYYKNENNEMFIDIILSNANWFQTDIYTYQNLWKKESNMPKDIYRPIDIITFELQNSSLFPKPHLFDKKKYLSIFECYPTERRINFTNEQLIQPIYIQDEQLNEIDNQLKKIHNLLTSNLTCNQELDKIFKQALNTEFTKDPEKDRVIESFLEQNRLCITFNLTPEFLDYKIRFIENLNTMMKSIQLSQDFNITHYIISNISSIIKIMIIKTMIFKLESIKINETTCWDIQNIISIIDNIIFTIDKLKIENENPFFIYEILFLLQCSYFYKKSQFEKYKSILDDMINQRDDLTLHQFMMGKGKTSVFTPLLALSSNIHMGKIPNIITTEHLKKNTIEYLSMLYTIFNLDYQVVTDYEYKELWLKNSHMRPNTHLVLLPKNISNYINIIDEFDLHHDYLQSMFNLVKERRQISEELFNYVFYYVYSKINNLDTWENFYIPEIFNNRLFDTILEKEYTNASKLRFNKDYGFVHQFEANDIRLCVPFSRKDTPLKHSNFSSILLTMILTIKYYIINQLQPIHDYKLIVNNYKKIIYVLPEHFFNEWMSYLAIHDKLSIELVQKTMDAIFIDDTYKLFQLNILKKFLYVVNENKLYYAVQQYNVSFQDVIYNVYNQWQVGYTGTMHLNLNTYFPEDRFVFRNKIEDFDEKIEVRLAIESYGSPSGFDKNSVICLNTNRLNTVDAQINFIMSHDFTRGLVDIAGLFIDYKNRYIAELLSDYLKEKKKKKIVYLDDNHQGMEYTNISDIDNRYTPFDKDNFYYYDQCHTVGTDLLHPNEGYIGVIINKNTKWTHFAQGIFRFRKLNHGTYMKIIYIHDDQEIFDSELTNIDVYRLIENNEKIFQTNQELGIKFQLLKAMTRKLYNNYIEKNVIHEFLLHDSLNLEHCKYYMIENIINLDAIINDRSKNALNTFIDDLYTSIINIGNTDQIMSLITGNINCQKQQEIDVNIELSIDRNIMSDLIIRNHPYYPHRVYDVITHLNCNDCFYKNAFPLFQQGYNSYINGKHVFISYNLFTYNNDFFKSIKTTPLVFVEFFDKILIEVYCVALDYYINKFPIYNFNGILLNTHLYNRLNYTNPFKLDIDYRIIYIFNIENYINPIQIKNNDQMTRFIYDQTIYYLYPFSGMAIYAIYANLHDNNYNFSVSFTKMPLLRIYIETYREQHSDDSEYSDHNSREYEIVPRFIHNSICSRHHPSINRIDNIYFNIFNNLEGIDLTIDEYLKVERIHFNIVYQEKYYSLSPNNPF